MRAFKDSTFTKEREEQRERKRERERERERRGKSAAGLGYRKSRSEARWCEEVMPGGSSGEVRPTASGSDAGAHAPGGKMSQSADAGQLLFAEVRLAGASN